MWHCVYMNTTNRREEGCLHHCSLTLTDLNVVRSDVEGCHQALQEISDPSEVGATDAPGAIHQQHDVCCCIAGTLKWFPWRHTLIKGNSLELIRLLETCGLPKSLYIVFPFHLPHICIFVSACLNA